MSDVCVPFQNIVLVKECVCSWFFFVKFESMSLPSLFLASCLCSSRVEIPSSFEGKISKLNIKVGDKVSEGDLILTLEKSSQINQKDEEKPIIEREFKKIEVIKPEIQQQTKVLNNVSNISSASPKARKFARELGVDINKVLGSERDGRVVEDDIKKFVALRSNNKAEVVEEKKSNKIKNEFEHSDFG